MYCTVENTGKVFILTLDEKEAEVLLSLVGHNKYGKGFARDVTLSIYNNLRDKFGHVPYYFEGEVEAR